MSEEEKIAELIKIVYDLIQDLHIGVLNSSGSWSLLLDRLKKLGGEKSLARVKEHKAELTASLNMAEPCKPTTDSKSPGCYQFTYCSECIISFDDCKREKKYLGGK